jgi:hypothetical protein
MNDRPLQLAVATVVALAILLAPQSLSAGSGSDTPPACSECKQPPACSGSKADCRKLPRVILYSYPSGELSVEGSTKRPDARLRPDEPVAVKVCCINPYRHTVNVKIDQTTFDELYKTPSDVTSGLQPSSKASTKPTKPQTPVAEANLVTAQGVTKQAQKTLESARTSLDSANEILASQVQARKLSPKGTKKNQAVQPRAEANARALVTKAKAKVADAEAAMDQAQALMQAAAQEVLPAEIKDFNDDIDRLLLVDEFPASQRARVLQIDDVDSLYSQSLRAAFMTASAAIDPDDPHGGVDCHEDVCDPEALMQLRARLAEDIEADFAELTDGIQKAKAADANRAKDVAKAQKDADDAQLLADHCKGSRSELARLRGEADKARQKAAKAKADAEAAKLVTDQVTAEFAKAEKRHEALGTSKAARDLQFASAMSVYQNVLDDDFGCLLFGPVASTGDQVEITVETPLAPEAANFTLSPEPAKSASGGAGSKKATGAKPPASQAALIIPVLGRHRPSFSTGIFFTGLVNPTFFKDKDGKAAMNQKDKFTPALGAMVHTPLVYWHKYTDFSLHLRLGVALRDGNPIYALGPSLIIGRRQRTVLTAAVAGGQVNQLSGSDRLGQPVVDTQPKTDKVFRYGLLVGITYNFGATPASNSGNSGTSSK